MKHSLPFIAVLMFAASSFAQSPFGVMPYGCPGLEIDKYAVLDEAKYKFSYKLTCVVDTVENTTITNNLILLVGPKFSKFFNVYPPQPKVKRNPHADGVSTEESRGLGATEVYKDLKKKKMVVTTRVWIPSTDIFTYEEELPTQKWKVLSDKKTIYGYNCRKATTTYLGRNYEAWFTNEIPLHNGPWKLGGLPGMILEANDMQRHFIFECIGIEKLKEKEEIVQYKWHYVKKTRKDVNNMIRRMHEDFFSYLATVSNGMYGGGHSKPEPYNPLERE